MNNINKYALEGTRVYISVFSNDNLTDITFRNISANAIDVPESELTAVSYTHLFVFKETE